MSDAQTQWSPGLELDEHPDGCRLVLVGVTRGHGSTLQEASADLLTRLFDLSVAVRRAAGAKPPVRGVHRPEVWRWLWRTGDLALRGEDLRAHVFGDALPV
ncbi:hypothetical protein Afil01_09880 [Actinorhabdospora filicis]|uniref:Uncharacterized protein n=1 Tax=Actinorhabdospora filicis TaxID=1785913 RepID=A0A9W6SKB5_9ACTN|nr:hypothetical protein [Actinorhabdospora filicis]GLZ76181.1 hypothetical protein Afil01_09880 [Actinorhabdospora filicis]